MNIKNSLTLDDWGKGLLISIISKAISDDKILNDDDIGKLREIKKQLQQSSDHVNSK